MQEFEVEEQVRPGTVRLPVSRPGPAVSHTLACAWSDEVERRLRGVGALRTATFSAGLAAPGPGDATAAWRDCSRDQRVIAVTATATFLVDTPRPILMVISRPR